MRRLLCAFAPLVVGCSIDDASITGKPCPCPSGYACDPVCSVCVPESATPGSHCGPGGTLSPYAKAVLEDTPSLYLRFGDSNGSVATDSSGKGNDASYEGAYTLGAPGALVDDVNTAVELSGVGWILSPCCVHEVAAQEPFSLEVWFRPTEYMEVHYLFSRQESGTSGYYVYALKSVGLVDFTRFSAGSGKASNAPLPTLDVWSHLVATYDGTVSRMYVNGELKGQIADSTSLPASAADLFIGSQNVAGGTVHGLLDEAAVYDHELPAPRVVTHYRIGSGSL